MRKGFTLVELLGVIVVLGIISLIAVPPIINQIRNIRESVSEDTLKLIYSSVGSYMDDNRNTYPLIEDREYCITLRELFNSGKLPSPLIDPYTNQEVPDTKEVYVKINQINDIEYELVEQGQCGYIDPSGASRPELVDGLLPITYDYDNNNWVKANTNSKWYDYNEQKWANAVLLTATSRGYYQNISPGEEIDEEDVLAYFVWIPRYRYRILNANYNDLSNRNLSFDIIFEGISTSKSSGTFNNDWLTHPAFTFGTKELNGFWVGKFTTGFSGATTAAQGVVSSPELESAIIKPNSIMWRGIELSNAYIVAKEFNDQGNMYGLSVDEVETRLLRNLDWGATAYLSRSIYGSNEQVWSNRNSSYITGCSSDVPVGGATTVCREYYTENGQKASTTGNVYGVYDMAGGAHEFVMAGTMNSGNTTVRTSGSGFGSNEYLTASIDSAIKAPFIDKYSYNTSVSNYAHSKLGDAIGETRGWDGGLSTAARGNTTASWYVRGGVNSSNPGASIFSFTAGTGAPSNAYGFRIAIHNK